MVGSNVLLSVAVSGLGPFAYQWRFNGTNLANKRITTVAGGGEGGLATNTSLYGPFGVALDTAGNLFVADARIGMIRRVGTNGLLTRVAGGGPSYPGDGGSAILASLLDPQPIPGSNTVLNVGGPTGVAVDAGGNLFIADPSDHRVRRVSPDGLIITVAGNGSPGYSGDGSPGTHAQLNQPAGVTLDGYGNLFIADQNNQRIRKLGTNGFITTVAGTGSNGFSGDGGLAIKANLNLPVGLAVDGHGNLFIADRNNQRIRKVGADGIITTVAGNGANSYLGDGGAATNATLSDPTGVAVDPSGNLFIADRNNSRIRKVGVDGIIATVAGNGTNSYSGDGGAATNAMLNGPAGVAVDPSGSLFIADYWNGRVRRVETNGLISTLAGTGSFGYSGDSGPATNASLYIPRGLVVDGVGNFFIADQNNHRVRRVATNGLITTVAGAGYPGYSGDNSAATNASLNFPASVALDAAGNLFIADSRNNLVRRVGIDGSITTVAGKAYAFPEGSGDGGAATNASLHLPLGVAVDGLGNLLIADSYDNRIRKVTSNGIITTVAGNGAWGYSGDGGAATNASLWSPWSVAVDVFGNLFIADYYNYRVRKVDTHGIITTVAGNGLEGYSGDNGAATNAALHYPAGVAVDALGNLYIADCVNNRVRKVGANGIITTVAGNGLYGYSGDGGPGSDASLWDPLGVAVDSFGNLFIADQGNNRIRQIGGPGTALQLDRLTLANAGLYDVVVANVFGSITSIVATLTAALPPLSARAIGPHDLQLQFTGDPGSLYLLLAADNLAPPVNWQPFYSNTANSAGDWTFTNTNIAAYPSRFYRLAVP